MTEKMLKLYNHPYIQNKRGEWQEGDMLYADAYTVPYSVFCPECQSQESMEDTGSIWLPRTIDDECPERGLLNMVKGSVYLASGIVGGAYDSKWICAGLKGGKNFYHYADTPTLGILMAIWDQQGQVK